MNNYEIIGVDFSDSENFLVVNYVCEQCKSVIASRKYNPEMNEVEVPFFISCPKCGTAFKGEIWENGVHWSLI